ncbi:MAG: IS1595 family transposase [Ferruginibacter sp.]|nr:IS1595 family transposase [Ferruginibacter sp.]
MNKYTITQFRKDYPDNDACLHKLFTLRFTNLVCPKCDSDKEFKRVKGKKSYQCPCCGYQVFPMAGTPFEKTTTPLTHWFYAIYLQTTTRNGVSAKELERSLNVCYKTALRMAHQIKRLMAGNASDKLEGVIEIDESYFGMKVVNMTKARKAKMFDEHGNFKDNKTGIMGFVARGGQVKTEVMHGGKTFKERVRNNVAKSATIVTDGHLGYDGLDLEFFKHEMINHIAGEYKRDEWHTNTIEGFWSQLKRTIKGTHIHCDAKYLQLYADEVSFRYMNRHNQDSMFEKVLEKVTL